MTYFGIWVDTEGALSGWLKNANGEVMHFPLRSIAEAQLESHRVWFPEFKTEIREFK